MEQLKLFSDEQLRLLLREEISLLQPQQTTHPAQDEIYGTEKAATFLGLKRSSLYGLVCQKKIPYAKKGKLLYFFKQDLIKWLHSGKQKTNDEIEREAERYVQLKRKGGKP
jgi:excisionase family DNA binding protein